MHYITVMHMEVFEVLLRPLFDMLAGAPLNPSLQSELNDSLPSSEQAGVQARQC